MVDSCEKSLFKTSSSRNHADRVLHSRFPPFGFVLKPVWSVHMFVGELQRIHAISHYSEHRFRETMPIVFVFKLLPMLLRELWRASDRLRP